MFSKIQVIIVFSMIVICMYKPTWPHEFKIIQSSLFEILDPLALRVDHMGSTSVPGLGAKDIIDIQVSARSLILDITQQLIQAGYKHQPAITHDHVPLGADPTPEHWAKLLFKQPNGQRLTNVHVRAINRHNQRYPLLFRDYLRAHPKSAQSIALIKREIAKRHAEDIDAYYDIKDPVYDLIWNAALEWAEYTDWEVDSPFQE